MRYANKIFLLVRETSGSQVYINIDHISVIEISGNEEMVIIHTLHSKAVCTGESFNSLIDRINMHLTNHKKLGDT